jgi:hypothetical protein
MPRRSIRLRNAPTARQKDEAPASGPDSAGAIDIRLCDIKLGSIYDMVVAMDIRVVPDRNVHQVSSWKKIRPLNVKLDVAVLVDLGNVEIKVSGVDREHGHPHPGKQRNREHRMKNAIVAPVPKADYKALTTPDNRPGERALMRHIDRDETDFARTSSPACRLEAGPRDGHIPRRQILLDDLPGITLEQNSAFIQQKGTLTEALNSD